MRLPPFTNLPQLDPDLFKDHSICAAGCLICANVGKAQERLVVFNPLTGKQRELPHLTNRRFPVLLHMIVDAKEESYKVIVAGTSRLGEEHLSKTTEVYDSSTNLWKVTEELPGPLFALNEHQTGAYINGILYCIAFLDGDRGKGLLGYSVAEEKWLPECTHPLPYSTSSNIVWNLLESNGELYLFSEIEQERRVEHRIDVFDHFCRSDETSSCAGMFIKLRRRNPGLGNIHEICRVGCSLRILIPNEPLLDRHGSVVIERRSGHGDE